MVSANKIPVALYICLIQAAGVFRGLFLPSAFYPLRGRPMKGLIVGLGNPEPKYLDTRHNLGFMAVDELLRKGDAMLLSNGKFKCDLWKIRLAGEDWLVAKPLTYMNLSGECVQPLAAWHRIEPQDILVIHDDLDLAPGRMKMKKGGGNAGHNGLKSITQLLSTPDFYRLRLGIGRPTVGETIGWVLGRMSLEDHRTFEKMLPTVLVCVQQFAKGETSTAIRTANGYTSDESTPKTPEGEVKTTKISNTTDLRQNTD